MLSFSPFIPMFGGDAVVAQVPDVVPRLRERVKGIVSKKLYSDRAWRELLKGQ